MACSFPIGLHFVRGSNGKAWLCICAVNVLLDAVQHPTGTLLPAPLPAASMDQRKHSALRPISTSSRIRLRTCRLADPTFDFQTHPSVELLYLTVQHRRLLATVTYRNASFANRVASPLTPSYKAAASQLREKQFPLLSNLESEISSPFQPGLALYRVYRIKS